MILRGIDFGNALIASGSLNFFDEGWRYHQLYKALFDGFDFSNTTFVAKTTTLEGRDGFMPLDQNLQPKELLPKCIVVNFRHQIVLNSVGLSGPGTDALLETGKWQKRTKPFFISFMAVGKTKEARFEEMRAFVTKLAKHLPRFKAKVGLQINISCPNAGHDPAELAHEAVQYLMIASSLDIPLDIKINALVPIETVRIIEETGLANSITLSNTISWGKLPERINWKKLFGSTKSPLEKFGGGGLSGKPLLPIVGEWVKSAREQQVKIPIVAGGGILKPKDADYLFGCGADAIAIGCVSILRPWNVKSIASRANGTTRR